jgi:hypothetical protein
MMHAEKAEEQQSKLDFAAGGEDSGPGSGGVDACLIAAAERSIANHISY